MYVTHTYIMLKMSKNFVDSSTAGWLPRLLAWD